MNNNEIKKLNLGCGQYRKEGYVNVDWSARNNPDVTHDLNVVPYPFEDASFDEIEMFHVLEHLDRPFTIMHEIHRILKPGGTFHMKVPHFSRGFTHAEHTHGFDITFPLYFRKDFPGSGFYGSSFELKKMELHWLAFFHLLPSMGYGTTMISFLRFCNVVISGLANLSQPFASRIWCFWVGGFDEIDFLFMKPKE